MDHVDFLEVMEVLRSGQLAPGPLGAEFGALVAAEYGCSFGLATNSCASALHLAAIALEVGRGYRVAVPALTCPSVKHPFRMCGADIVIVDVDPVSHQISIADTLELAARRCIDGVLVPHRYGHVCDLSPLVEAGLDVIEDFAHAAGADGPSGRANLQGTVGVFSTYATKMVASGCGGAVITRSTLLAERMTAASEYYSLSADWDEIRYNYRMPDLNAALVLAQWRRLPKLVAARHAVAQFFSSRLPEWLDVVAPAQGQPSSWYRYIVRAESRTEQAVIMQQGREAGVCLGTIDIALPPAELAKQAPAAFREWERAISLPIYPTLNEDQRVAVIGAILGQAV